MLLTRVTESGMTEQLNNSNIFKSAISPRSPASSYWRTGLEIGDWDAGSVCAHCCWMAVTSCGSPVTEQERTVHMNVRTHTPLSAHIQGASGYETKHVFTRHLSCNPLPHGPPRVPCHFWHNRKGTVHTQVRSGPLLLKAAH